MPEITGLLLAAGKSQRFGTQKLLAEYQGLPIVLHSARALSNCDRVIAIINDKDIELQKTLDAAGVETVINPEADRGMGHSIACGVKASQGSDGWCILPADMPHVSMSTVERVYEALVNGAPIAAPCYQDQRGHPVGFSQRFAEELQILDGDIGARTILQRQAQSVLRIVTNDSGILLDIDTREDLERALNH
jgi:molybdenum cofactor cytidylyltransferase